MDLVIKVSRNVKHWKQVAYTVNAIGKLSQNTKQYITTDNTGTAQQSNFAHNWIVAESIKWIKSILLSNIESFIITLFLSYLHII